MGAGSVTGKDNFVLCNSNLIYLGDYIQPWQYSAMTLRLQIWPITHKLKRWKGNRALYVGRVNRRVCPYVKRKNNKPQPRVLGFAGYQI